VKITTLKQGEIPAQNGTEVVRVGVGRVLGTHLAPDRDALLLEAFDRGSSARSERLPTDDRSDRN
jgi:hypothetical protein